MPFSSQRLRQIAALLTALAAVGGARAADELTGTSPFLPPASAGNNAAQSTPSPIELRGVMTEGGVTRFSIYDPSRRISSWAKIDEIGRDFIVRSYDPAKESVTVDYAGRTLTLTLHTAKVASAPVNIPPPQAAVAAQPVPQPVGGPVVLNPTPADEQRRLEAIAAEVNRRRMLRQQALQASRQAQQQALQPGQQPVRPNGQKPPPAGEQPR